MLLINTHHIVDLQVISYWAFQWKMRFRPGPNKQAQQVYFSKKADRLFL